MLDRAGIFMEQGYRIACERKEGVNDNMCNSHYHDFFEMYYLESGKRIHVIEEDSYNIEAGQVVLFPPYVMHRSCGEANVPFRRIVLYFRKEEISSPQLASTLEKAGGVYITDNSTKHFIHMLLKLILKENEEGRPYENDYKRATLNLLVITLLRHGTPKEPKEKQSRIEEIIKFIHTHYNESLSLHMLSKKFFISPYYLCREFRSNTNRTIIKYINITRIMNAKRKLMETNLSITEVANQTGFSSITHFNRVFKALEGKSPSNYRRANKNQGH